MTKKKKTTAKNEFSEILASTGFLFPRNEVELSKFETLFGDSNYGLTGDEIDPNVIIKRNPSKSKVVHLSNLRRLMPSENRLVARNNNDQNRTIDNKVKKKNPKNDLNK